MTGGSGFVGGHLACLLAASGFAVTAPLRGRTGIDRLRAAGVTVVPAKPFKIAGNVDAVVHAAATSPGPGINLTATQLVADNVDFTREVLAAAEQANAGRFVFLSSMSVYGDISVAEVAETTPFVNPDVYGTTKLLGEALLAERSGSMAGLAIRLPAVIGAGAARHWLAEAARRLVADEDVTVFHAAAPFNNAVHVSDLARLIGGFIRGPAAGYDAINVASSGRIAVAEAVDILRRATGSRSRVTETAPTRPSFTISIARAEQKFAFRPMTIGAAVEAYARDVSDFESTRTGATRRPVIGRS